VSFLRLNRADFPALVVKANGLAAGKGVIVAKDKAEACKAVSDILTVNIYISFTSTEIYTCILEFHKQFIQPSTLPNVSVMAFLNLV